MKTNENPFIECLPEILDQRAFFSKITEKPAMTPGSSLIENLSFISMIRENIFIPFTYHYFLYIKIQNIIRANYQTRTSLEWIKSLLKTKKWYDQPNQQPPFNRRSTLGLTVLGVSGMGKTTSLDKILNLFQQVIVHRNLGIKQVVYLKIDCTIKGSTKQICRSFFDELDRVTGENYTQKTMKDPEEKLIIQMANKAILHQLGVLVIDEVHNLATVSPTSRQTVLNFFKLLTNKIGIPIIYVGTDEAVPILFGNYQTASRTQGVGMQVLDRFKEDDEEWNYLLEKLWDCQVFKNPGKISKEVKRMYYSQSQGIIRELIQVHCNAQEITLYNNGKAITADHIKATQQMLNGTSRAMAGLRNSNRTTLSHFNDLNMTAAHLFNDTSDVTSNDETEKKKLFKVATRMHPTLNQIQLDESISAILKTYPESPIEDKIEKLLSGIANLIQQGKAKPKVKLGPAKGSLIEMCVNAKTSQDYYEMLLGNGVISELPEIVPL
jgi:SpoVK/Ycf46/Vps4 family AAA+-type ATPase